MKRFKTDLYVGDVYVKTYFVNAEDDNAAYDEFLELMWKDVTFDTEEIDE